MTKRVNLISPSGFRALLSSSGSHSRVIPIDATWYMPNVSANGRTEFFEERIPNAAFFDLDKVALAGSPYPHMLPKYVDFVHEMNKLKLSNNDTLVVYDKQGIFSCPRVAWTFSLFCHQKVYVLDSYLTYKDSQYPLETKQIDAISTSSTLGNAGYEKINNTIVSQLLEDNVISYEKLFHLVETGKLQENYIVFDARSTQRFTGKSPEPRKGLSSGHIPSALSLPFSKVLDEKTFKTRDDLLRLFKNEFEIDFTKVNPTGGKEIIVMCGTGVSAVILRLALESIIQTDVPIKVYDGSWTEWAQRAPQKYIIKDS